MANVSGFRRMPRSKAPEHRRIPKRKRELDVEAAAHVLECGAAAPLSMHWNLLCNSSV